MLKLFNLDEKIVEERDTLTICLRSVSRQLKRVAAEKANVRFSELDRGKGTWRLKAQDLECKPVEWTEDKELNLRLRQRGASGLLRILKSFLSFIRWKIGSHLSLENKMNEIFTLWDC